MVQISRTGSQGSGLVAIQKRLAKVVIFIGAVYFIIGASVSLSMMDEELEAQQKMRRGGRTLKNHPTMVNLESDKGKRDTEGPSCYYKSLSALSEDEMQPVADQRHMVTPPMGGKLSLVCCETTVGPLSIVAHEKWAPIGAKFFLEMVTTGYFNAGIGVPLMRCVKNFLCQFGLSSDPTAKEKLKTKGSLPDDPNWLPEGPEHRTNGKGVKRFARGYLAYAGSGQNSRGRQLIVALKDNPRLAGGSPWEVPWGELVGPDSFKTLGKIYTGYGENGPPQGRLMKEGVSDAVKKEWPALDYIKSCQVLDEMVQEQPLREIELN
eukprot:scaffold4481_cov121-Cylindrotheca_fusiformis.AAC.12